MIFCVDLCDNQHLHLLYNINPLTFCFYEANQHSMADDVSFIASFYHGRYVSICSSSDFYALQGGAVSHHPVTNTKGLKPPPSPMRCACTRVE